MNTPHRNHLLRVAVVFEYPSLNGGEFSWLATLPALRSNGIEPFAIAPDQGPLADRLRTENVVIENWQLREDGQKLPQPILRERLAEILNRSRPDLVHANSLSISRTIGPVTAEQQIPSIGHIRDIVRLSRKAVTDLNQVSRLLAVSHATRDWHIAGGIDPRRIYVQYNGIDLQQFAPQTDGQSRGTLHDRLGIDPNCRLIGCIGQLGIRKGTEKVLESAALVADNFPDVHWVVAGQRHSEKAEAVEFESNLHRMAATAPLAGRVHFPGRISNVPDWMRDLTLLVHAARQEPLGRVLLEAAATGLPIVATDAGGTREVLGQNGHIVPIDDTNALARTIDNVLSDHADSAARGRASRSRASLAFDARKRGKQLSEHYHAVAAEAGTRHTS